MLLTIVTYCWHRDMYFEYDAYNEAIVSEHVYKQCYNMPDSINCENYYGYTIADLNMPSNTGIKFQQAHLEPGEQETAEDAVKLLSHAESIKAHLYQAAQYLSESDSDTILHLLKAVQNECDAIKDINQEYLELYNRVSASLVELKDIAYEIAAKEQAADINPQELEQLNERLDLIYTLQHKYHVDSVQELLDILAKLQEEAGKYADTLGNETR